MANLPHTISVDIKLKHYTVHQELFISEDVVCMPNIINSYLEFFIFLFSFCLTTLLQLGVCSRSYIPLLSGISSQNMKTTFLYFVDNYTIGTFTCGTSLGLTVLICQRVTMDGRRTTPHHRRQVKVRHVTSVSALHHSTMIVTYIVECYAQTSRHSL